MAHFGIQPAMHTGTVLFRRARPEDYPALLRLQSENFIGNLTEGEAKDGFLSIEYTADQFDEINHDLGISVALRNDQLVGYLCATTLGYGSRFPILHELIRRLRNRSIHATPVNEATTFIYGPVCVSRSLRGTGVLDGLFGVIRELARPRYRQCILFVSDKNPRSFHAHFRKLGMQDLGMFGFAGKQFHMLGTAIRHEDGVKP